MRPAVATVTLQENPLGIGVTTALVLHCLVIFGLSFDFLDRPAPATTLEITLTQHPAENAPQDSDYIAEFHQLGSGEQAKRQEITTDHLAPIESPVLQASDIPLPQQTLQRRRATDQQALVSSGTGGDSRTVATEPHEDSAEEQALTLRSPREIASLRAKLANQRQTYSRIPRTLVLTTASARAADQAGYLKRWITWVEKIGNENYPQEARRRNIYGAIRLAVTLERDGNVAGVEILQSSGQRVLDQAAIRIVRLASPFEPIPSAIQEDRIEVIRTWNFIPGNLFASTGE